MPKPTFTVEVGFAWWLSWYMEGLVLVALLMHTEPDPAKFEAVLKKALRVRVRCTCS